MTSVYGYGGLVDAIRSEMASGRRVQVAGISPTLAELVLLRLACDQHENPRPIVLIVPTTKDISVWLNFLSTATLGMHSALPQFAGALLPFYSSFGNDRFINHSLARRHRLYALEKLRELQSNVVVVTTLQALGQTTIPSVDLQRACVQLRVGDEIDQDRLISELEDLGYTPAATVTDEGTYSVRGGIIDVFSIQRDEPVRIEFIGDTVSSMRVFNATDQKSRGALENLLVVPTYEAITPASSRKDQAQQLFNTLLEQNVPAADRDGMVGQFQQGLKFNGFDMLAPIFRPTSVATLATFPESVVFLFPQSITACFEAYTSHVAAIDLAYQQDQARQRPVLPPASHFVPAASLTAFLDARARVIEFGNPFASERASFLRTEARFVIPGAPMAQSPGAELFDKWIQLFDEVTRQKDGTVALLAQHEEQCERIVNLLKHRGFKPLVDPDLLLKISRDQLKNGSIHVGRGNLSSHAWFEDKVLLLVPEQALFGTPPRKPKPASQKLQNFLNSFADLKVGDLVVHVQHGIGRYTGLTSLVVAGLASDFLLIEYAGGDKVYLPVDRLSLLQRYNSGTESGGHHALDKLGGLGWERRKAKAKGAIQDMAAQLLKLHAQRSIATLRPYTLPDDEYLKFEAEFPYDETDDQLRAIHDVESDLGAGKPMDRLVCGDVGFGKTEVALRATMRTVLEGSQVLVLVPTTVLCYQHYRTFKQRLENHGVRVSQVNRFVSAAAIKEATEGLAKGNVDVLIGTHRLLSKDIKPRRLGLLVVDEEQRFGVTHKEKLKEVRAGAHVLTLTATPIPRTLHMAMIGMRDISIIATPPPDRMSIKTYIARFDETLIKEAIEHEVRRGGQVFFVHNRVEDIEEMRLFLKALVPFAEVRVGHGQMPEHQLERVIVDFIEQKFQVLLCTTIIESGIDMPNVNTLLVDHADRFGLAQLYQLKGRVGRSNQQAYAYFLTPAEDRLSDEGRKRLDVLAAHQELGAGFQIASHDLELRGAGNLLGGEQSGHASAVGLELYTEMLEDAIHSLRGEPVQERLDTEIKLPLSAFIAPAYVPAESQRLQLYKRLFASESDGELRALRQEMEDRFGGLPDEVGLLFKVARLKQQLKQISALRLTSGKGVCEIRFAPLADSMIDRILAVMARQPGLYKLAPDNRLLLFLETPAKPSLAEQEAMLTILSGLVAPLVDSFAQLA